LIELKPLAAAMGAEIRGVSIPKLTNEAFAEVEATLFRHKMIFFRAQKLTHAEHEEFSLRFGAFAENAYTEGIAGYANIQPVLKAANDRSRMIFGSGWHTDAPYTPGQPSDQRSDDGPSPQYPAANRVLSNSLPASRPYELSRSLSSLPFAASCAP